MRPRPDPTPSRDAASHANPPPRPAARRLLLRALQDTEVRGLLRGDLHTGAHIHGPGAHAASARDGARTRFRGYPVLTRCWMAPIVARVAGGAVQPGVRHQLTERAAARHEGTAGQPAAEPARKAGGTSGGRKSRAVWRGGSSALVRDADAHARASFSSPQVHRLLITSIMLASKFFDDVYYNNAYYARVGGISNIEARAAPAPAAPHAPYSQSRQSLGLSAIRGHHENLDRCSGARGALGSRPNSKAAPQTGSAVAPRCPARGALPRHAQAAWRAPLLRASPCVAATCRRSTRWRWRCSA